MKDDFFSKEKTGKIEDWVIYAYDPPYPTGYAKILQVLNHSYCLNCQLQVWDKNFCQVFSTEDEAKESYENFTKNKNNYAYEG